VTTTSLKMPGPVTAAKKPKLDENEISISDGESKSIEMIEACQKDIEDLADKETEEILIVEKKYNKLRKPYYTQMSELAAKVPDFWFTSTFGHYDVKEILRVGEEEEFIEKCFSKLQVEEFPEQISPVNNGYKLTVTFRENAYFTNAELMKEFKVSEDTGILESTSTPINWKEGKDLTKPDTTGTAKEGFFIWYLDNDNPPGDLIAEAIKDEVWVNPLKYYLNPCFGESSYSDGETSSLGENDSENEDEEDEDEDDEEEVEISDESE